MRDLEEVCDVRPCSTAIAARVGRIFRGFRATRVLIILLLPIVYYGYMMGISSTSVVQLGIFWLEALTLAICYDLESSRMIRIAVLSILTVTVLSFVATLPMYSEFYHRLDGWIVFKGADAVRQGQSPYSASLNLGPPPVYILAGVLGKTFGVFQKNLLMLDRVCILMIGIVVTTGLFAQIRRTTDLFKIAELMIGAALLIIVFGLFFRLNTYYGNFPVSLALLVILLMVSHYFKRPVITGLLLGMAISLKPYFIVVVVGGIIYMFVRNDRKALIVALSVLLLGAVTAVVLELVPGGLGLSTYSEFLTDVSRVHILGMLRNVDNISMWSTLSNMGFAIRSGLFSVIGLGYACSGGLILCRKDPRASMPVEHLVYYLLLTTLIFPLVWSHYYSWLLGPALYMLWLLHKHDDTHFVPVVLFCIILLMFDPLAWIATLLLPAICFVSIKNSTHKEFSPEPA